MAVKDAFCNHAAGLPEGLADLDVSHLCEEISPGWWKCKFHEDSCEEEKWVGAPDKEGEAVGTSGYPFKDLEAKWQAYWKENETFRTPPARSSAVVGDP